jgi:phosphatidylglycerophosphate synthase
MGRGRSAVTAIDVAYLTAGTSAPDGDGDLFTAPVAADGFGLTRLRKGLHEQGIPTATTSVIDCAVVGQARSRLIAALAGPHRSAGGASAGSLAESLPSIAVLDADVLVNAPPLGAVLDDPRIRTGALTVLDEGRQVHLGVLKVDGEDRAVAAELVRGLRAGLGPGDLVLELTRALAGAAVPVQPVPLGGYAWARPAAGDQAAQAEAQIDAVDERTVRLREAARGGDGFYSTFVLRRLSWRLTDVAERTGLTPNQVTLISFGLGLLAAGFLALGSRPWAVLGAVLLQICLLVDCVDGELARYRRRFSRFGAWLDATTDRVKEFAVIAALAVGAARHGSDLWWLVAAAIAVQTFRNLFDLGWSLQRTASGVLDVESRQAEVAEWVESPTRFRAPRSEPTAAGALSWVRRIGHFPIGERFLLISVGAAFWTARGTLIALLVAGLLSAGYMLAAFAVRSRSGSAAAIASVAGSEPESGLADTGPLLRALILRSGMDRAGRLAAVLPALIAVAELALIWWLAVEVAGARGCAAVLLLAVTAVAHYQQAYGVREGSDGSGSLVLGTDLRLIVLVLVGVVPAVLLPDPDGGEWATVAVWALAALVAVSSTARSLRFWTDPGGRSRHAGGTPARSGDPKIDQQSVLREALGSVR